MATVSSDTVGESSCFCDPNFAVICSFLSKFGSLIGFPVVSFKTLKVDLEDNKQLSPQLSEILLRLLRRLGKTVHQDKLDRAIVKFSYTYSGVDGWEIEELGFTKAKLETKLRILKNLLEAQFDTNNKFKEKVNQIPIDVLHVLPIGRDKNGHAYWYLLDQELNLTIYREDEDDIDAETWQIVCSDRDDLQHLIANLELSAVITLEQSTNSDDSNSSNVKSQTATNEVKCEKTESSLNADEGAFASVTVKTETSDKSDSANYVREEITETSKCVSSAGQDEGTTVQSSDLKAGKVENVEDKNDVSERGLHQEQFRTGYVKKEISSDVCAKGEEEDGGREENEIDTVMGEQFDVDRVKEELEEVKEELCTEEDDKLNVLDGTGEDDSDGRVSEKKVAKYMENASTHNDEGGSGGEEITSSQRNMGSWEKGCVYRGSDYSRTERDVERNSARSEEEISKRVDEMSSVDEKSSVDKMSSVDKTSYVEKLSIVDEMSSVDETTSVNETNSVDKTLPIKEPIIVDQISSVDKTSSISEKDSANVTVSVDQTSAVDKTVCVVSDSDNKTSAIEKTANAKTCNEMCENKTDISINGSDAISTVESSNPTKDPVSDSSIDSEGELKIDLDRSGKTSDECREVDEICDVDSRVSDATKLTNESAALIVPYINLEESREKNKSFSEALKTHASISCVEDAHKSIERDKVNDALEYVVACVERGLDDSKGECDTDESKASKEGDCKDGDSGRDVIHNLTENTEKSESLRNTGESNQSIIDQSTGPSPSENISTRGTDVKISDEKESLDKSCKRAHSEKVLGGVDSVDAGQLGGKDMDGYGQQKKRKVVMDVGDLDISADVAADAIVTAGSAVDDTGDCKVDGKDDNEVVSDNDEGKVDGDVDGTVEFKVERVVAAKKGRQTNRAKKPATKLKSVDEGVKTVDDTTVVTGETMKEGGVSDAGGKKSSSEDLSPRRTSSRLRAKRSTLLRTAMANAAVSSAKKRMFSDDEDRSSPDEASKDDEPRAKRIKTGARPGRGRSSLLRQRAEARKKDICEESDDDVPLCKVNVQGGRKSAGKDKRDAKCDSPSSKKKKKPTKRKVDSDEDFTLNKKPNGKKNGKNRGRTKRRRSSSEEEEEEESEIESEESLVWASSSEPNEESCDEVEYKLGRNARRAAARASHVVDKVTDDFSPCKICGKVDQPELILLCDKCDIGYHTACLRPPLMIIPADDWFCPICEHKMLITELMKSLQDLDSALKKKDMLTKREERLKFVGISLSNIIPEVSNIIPEEDKENARPTEEKEEKVKEEKEEESESGSSSGSSSADSKKARNKANTKTEDQRLRRARNHVNYKFTEYFDLINEAIGAEDEEVEKPHKRKSGKDMSNITGVSDDSDNPPPLISSKRNKRKLTELDLDSNTDESDEYCATEDTEGEVSAEDEEEAPETDSSNGVVARKVNRSRRAGKRNRRAIKDFLDDGESDDDLSRRRSTRTSSKRSVNYRDPLSDSEEEPVAEETTEEEDVSYSSDSSRGSRSRKKNAGNKNKKKEEKPAEQRQRKRVVYSGSEEQEESDGERKDAKSPPRKKAAKDEESESSESDSKPNVESTPEKSSKKERGEANKNVVREERKRKVSGEKVTRSGKGEDSEKTDENSDVSDDRGSPCRALPRRSTQKSVDYKKLMESSTEEESDSQKVEFNPAPRKSGKNIDNIINASLDDDEFTKSNVKLESDDDGSKDGSSEAVTESVPPCFIIKKEKTECTDSVQEASYATNSEPRTDEDFERRGALDDGGNDERKSPQTDDCSANPSDTNNSVRSQNWNVDSTSTPDSSKESVPTDHSRVPETASGDITPSTQSLLSNVQDEETKTFGALSPIKRTAFTDVRRNSNPSYNELQPIYHSQIDSEQSFQNKDSPQTPPMSVAGYAGNAGGSFDQVAGTGAQYAADYTQMQYPGFYQGPYRPPGYYPHRMPPFGYMSPTPHGVVQPQAMMPRTMSQPLMGHAQQPPRSSEQMPQHRIVQPRAVMGQPMGHMSQPPQGSYSQSIGQMPHPLQAMGQMMPPHQSLPQNMRPMQPGPQGMGHIPPNQQNIEQLQAQQQKIGHGSQSNVGQAPQTQQNIDQMPPNQQNPGQMQSGLPNMGQIQPSQQNMAHMPQNVQKNSKMIQNQQNFGQSPQNQSDIPQNQQSMGPIPTSQQGMEPMPQNQQNISQMPKNQQNMGQTSQNLQNMGQISQNQQNMGQMLPNQQNMHHMPLNQHNLSPMQSNQQNRNRMPPNPQNMGHMPQNPQNMGQMQPKQTVSQMPQNQQNMSQMRQNLQNMSKMPSPQQNVSQMQSNQQTMGHMLPHQQNMGHMQQSQQNMSQMLSAQQSIGHMQSNQQNLDQIQSNQQNSNRLPQNPQNMGQMQPNQPNMGQNAQNQQNMCYMPQNQQNVHNLPPNLHNMSHMPQNQQNVNQLPQNQQNMNQIPPNQPTIGQVPYNQHNVNQMQYNQPYMGPMPTKPQKTPSKPKQKRKTKKNAEKIGANNQSQRNTPSEQTIGQTALQNPSIPSTTQVQQVSDEEHTNVGDLGEEQNSSQNIGQPPSKQKRMGPLSQLPEHPQNIGHIPPYAPSMGRFPHSQGGMGNFVFNPQNMGPYCTPNMGQIPHNQQNIIQLPHNQMNLKPHNEQEMGKILPYDKTDDKSSPVEQTLNSSEEVHKSANIKEKLPENTDAQSKPLSCINDMTTVESEKPAFSIDSILDQSKNSKQKTPNKESPDVDNAVT